MVAGSIREAVLDLLWNAWAELGVPGTSRRFQRVALDPDPFLVFTPALASDDPRLLEQVAAWCEHHGDRIAKTRLLGLSRGAPPEVAVAFAAFTARLGGAAAPWSSASATQGRRPLAQPSSARSRGSTQAAARAADPPLQRPALARLRMRALAGTGARADVLCELLASPPGAWTSATDLQRLGYTRRSVARVLADLAAAGIASERTGKAPIAFRLREPRLLHALVAGENLTWPDGSAVVHLAWHLLTLERSAPASSGLAQVKAHDAWDDLRRLALATGSSEPPVTAGDPAAWPNLLAWGARALRAWPAALALAAPPAAGARRAIGRR